MDWNILFFLNSALLGVGLAMDAFSVSIVSGLNESNMKKSKAMEIAGVFAFFQALMPMLGWMLVSFLAEKFTAFQIYIPWVAYSPRCGQSYRWWCHPPRPVVRRCPDKRSW